MTVAGLNLPARGKKVAVGDLFGGEKRLAPGDGIKKRSQIVPATECIDEVEEQAIRIDRDDANSHGEASFTSCNVYSDSNSVSGSSSYSDDDNDDDDDDDGSNENELVIRRPPGGVKRKVVVGTQQQKSKLVKRSVRVVDSSSDDSSDSSSEEDETDAEDDDDGDKVHINPVEMEEYSAIIKGAASPKALKKSKNNASVPMPNMPVLERNVAGTDNGPLALMNPFSHPPTVWFEYPSWLNIERDRLGQHLEPISNPNLLWNCYWERNCLKDVFSAAGFTGGKRKAADGKKAAGALTQAGRRRYQVLWQKHLKPSEWRELGPDQRHNHFCGSRALGRKDDIARTLSKKKRAHPKHFNFHPESFVLPEASSRLYQLLATSKKKTSWIKKPLASAQGRGIRVISDKTALKMVSAKKREKGGAPSTLPVEKSGGLSLRQQAQRGCIIQRYIERPLLINRYKFDIRVYVLVTSYNPLRAYLFPEGLARFCTEKYSLKSKKNRFGHLTNYSINKKNETFQHNQDAEDDSVGSKWSLSALYRFLEAKYGPDVCAKARTDMKMVIAKTLIAADDDINSKMNARVANQQACFELFGFDLMLDKNFKTWLVEVNISPSLMTASPLDKKVKTILVCDTLNLVGVPVRTKAPNAATSSVSSASTKSSAASLRRTKQPMMNGRKKLFQPKTKGPKNRPSRNVLSIPKKTWTALSAEDRTVIEHVVAENARRGHFERIFPPVNNPDLHEELMKLFTVRRYYNALVQRFEGNAAAEYEKITGRRPY